MKGTLKLKSELLYTVEVSNTESSVQVMYPISGDINLPDSALKQLSADAEKFGSWQSVQIMELSTDSYNIEILVKDLPFENKLNFETTSVLP